MLPSRYVLSLALMPLMLSVSASGKQQGQASPSSAQSPQPSSPQGQSQQGQSQQGQDGSVQPIPAYRSPLASAADNGSLQQETGAEQLVPDTRLPAGAQNLSLGAPKTGHGYWEPFIDIASEAYSNYGAGPGSSSWSTFGSVSGGINLREISGRSDFTLSYLGGTSISGDSGDTADVQELGLIERFSWRRSSFAVMDQLAYLPQSFFGYNGLGTGSEAGTLNTAGNLGLQNGFTTVQSILNPSGRYLSNSSVLEISRYLTPRSSFTVVGDYSIVRFLDNNNLSDSNETILQAGYNYQMTRKSTIAVFYRFDGFRYSNGTQSINDHSGQLSYARRLVGRLTFQVSAGPDFVVSRLPLSTNVSIPATGNTTQLSWQASTNLMYQMRKSSFGLNYFHGVTDGSGVLAGSTSDTVSADATRQFTRKSNVVFTVGYSRSTGVPILDATSTSKLSNEDFDFWYGGATLNHDWGPSMKIYLGYEGQYQTSSGQSCTTAAPCLSNFTNHQVYFGLGWHPQHSFR